MQLVLQIIAAWFAISVVATALASVVICRFKRAIPAITDEAGQ